jgi:uncharacterized repeat protein (TIGR02543 family)
LNNPTKTGYTFAGWTGTNGTTPQTAVSVSLGSTGDRNYVANWTLNTYTVIFDANGGTVSSESGTTGEDWTLAELPTPTRTGYTFDGWYHLGTQITTSTIFSEHTTIYALWTLNTYTVTFVDHDGTQLWHEMVDHGSTATAPTAPTREGYTFTNWNAAFDNVTSDLIVTAVYEESVPILPHKIANSNMLMPTHNGITLTAKTNATIAVYNLSGKLISRQNYNPGNHSISLGHLPKGMYIVKASHGSEKQILRVPVK